MHLELLMMDKIYLRPPKFKNNAIYLADEGNVAKFLLELCLHSTAHQAKLWLSVRYSLEVTECTFLTPLYLKIQKKGC